MVGWVMRRNISFCQKEMNGHKHTGTFRFIGGVCVCVSVHTATHHCGWWAWCVIKLWKLMIEIWRLDGYLWRWLFAYALVWCLIHFGIFFYHFFPYLKVHVVSSDDWVKLWFSRHRCIYRIYSRREKKESNAVRIFVFRHNINLEIGETDTKMHTTAVTTILARQRSLPWLVCVLGGFCGAFLLLLLLSHWVLRRYHQLFVSPAVILRYIHCDFYFFDFLFSVFLAFFYDYYHWPSHIGMQRSIFFMRSYIRYER